MKYGTSKTQDSKNSQEILRIIEENLLWVNCDDLSLERKIDDFKTGFYLYSISFTFFIFIYLNFNKKVINLYNL